jgi:hypothetical protein
MKHFLFLFFFLLYASGTDDFVDLTLPAHEFEFIEASSSDDILSDENLFHFNRLPLNCQFKIIKLLFNTYHSSDIWKMLYFWDIQYNKSLANVKISEKQKAKNLKTYHLFLKYGFNAIKKRYTKDQNSFLCDIAVFNCLSTEAHACFKKSVYDAWPYCLQKYSTSYIHQSVNELDVIECILKGYEIQHTQEEVRLRRPLYDNFETPQLVFIAACVGLLSDKYHKNNDFFKSWDDHYRKKLARFLDKQTLLTFTIPSFKLRQEVEKLFRYMKYTSEITHS